MNLTEKLDELCDALETVGIDAQVDPRDVNPPCAWVAARSMNAGKYLCGGGEFQVEVYLIVPDTGTPNALAKLSEMLEKTLEVIEPDEPVSLSESVTLPGGGQPLPAFQITVNIPIG